MSRTITFDLPTALEPRLRGETGDLTWLRQHAKVYEAVAAG